MTHPRGGGSSKHHAAAGDTSRSQLWSSMLRVLRTLRACGRRSRSSLSASSAAPAGWSGCASCSVMQRLLKKWRQWFKARPCGRRCALMRVHCAVRHDTRAKAGRALTPGNAGPRGCRRRGTRRNPPPGMRHPCEAPVRTANTCMHAQPHAGHMRVTRAVPRDSDAPRPRARACPIRSRTRARLRAAL